MYTDPYYVEDMEGKPWVNLPRRNVAIVGS